MEKVPERLSPGEKFTPSMMKEHLARYFWAAQFVAGKVVLDIACGTGYGSGYLINKGAKMVVGGDYSEKAIEYARLHYQKDGLRFLRCDAQQMPFANNSFDVIVSFETIEHLERYEDFLKECNRVVKDDGTFICSTPNRKARFGYKNPIHFKEFSTEELYELLVGYFGEVKLYGQSYLTKIDILTKGLMMRLRPITAFIPQPVKHFVRRFIFGEERLIPLAKDKMVVDNEIAEGYIPSLLTQDSPLHKIVIAVARKRDG
ncbi:class I SAM-dependent methyltransferase [Dehalococcoidia bacterium]|nr:class I SAM-dependent methyltransferase [Dehalococcoidia bacterium]